MKNKTIKYVLIAGLFLTMTSLGRTQSSAAHTVRIVVLKHNEMTLAGNDQQKNTNIVNLKWQSHNPGQKITIMRENNEPGNNLKIVYSDISRKTSHSEIPVTNVPTSLINESNSDRGNCQFQLITNIHKGKNTAQPVVMYTLTDV